jgi:hypothetical protein
MPKSLKSARTHWYLSKKGTTCSAGMYVMLSGLGPASAKPCAVKTYQNHVGTMQLKSICSAVLCHIAKKIAISSSQSCHHHIVLGFGCLSYSQSHCDTVS